MACIICFSLSTVQGDRERKIFCVFSLEHSATALTGQCLLGAGGQAKGFLCDQLPGRCLCGGVKKRYVL